MKRWKKAIKTNPVLQKSKFDSKYLNPYKDIIPIFILAGLKSKKINIVDVWSLADYFLREDDSLFHKKVVDDIERYAIYVNQNNYADFLSVLTGGMSTFEDSYELDSFYSEEKLLEKYEPDEYSIGKYLFLGSGGLNWYQNTLMVFEKKLKNYDIDLFVKLFAITSPRSHFKSNLRFALKAYDLIKKGKSLERISFLPPVSKMLCDFREKDFFMENNPKNERRKIINFARAILGDKDAVVVDSRVLEACGLGGFYVWRGNRIFKPKGTEYDIIENYVKKLAMVCGYEPRQITSMFWTGVKTESKHKEIDTAKILDEILNE